jgi:hypothetical protein
LDEARHRFDRDERRVLVPAASSFGLDDLELSDGLRSVYLFGIVTPNIPTVGVLVHAREFLMARSKTGTPSAV